MSSKRLQKELVDFQKDAPDWCGAQLSGDSLYKWRAWIEGPADSPYEKGKFQIDLEIPQEYPFKPPKLTFATKIYHPNIKSDGSVCSEVIGEGWSPQLKIQEVLMTMRALLKEPNTETPLEPEIAQQIKSHPNEYTKTAKEWTKKYAK
eukprot:TRINITY_DN1978_c0_g1_i1.p1 TRINITY_DN1978_c0_g1~~TRINITY_DN1978_c0_g1_i1.p1  ORF type:complete len:148 (-),score=28.52 TRINITY_DN1978_c0_g1_i1:132-575(-)